MSLIVAVFGGVEITSANENIAEGFEQLEKFGTCFRRDEQRLLQMLERLIDQIKLVFSLPERMQGLEAIVDFQHALENLVGLIVAAHAAETFRQLECHKAVVRLHLQNAI